MEEKNSQPLAAETIAQIKARCEKKAAHRVAADLGVSTHTIFRAISGIAILRGTRLLMETRLKELAAKEKVSP